jgi:hypothetical protein
MRRISVALPICLLVLCGCSNEVDGPDGGKAKDLVRALANALVEAAASDVDAAGPSYVALGDSYASGVGTRTYISDGTSC